MPCPVPLLSADSAVARIHRVGARARDALGLKSSPLLARRSTGPQSWPARAAAITTRADTPTSRAVADFIEDAVGGVRTGKQKRRARDTRRRCAVGLPFFDCGGVGTGSSGATDVLALLLVA